MWLPNGVTRAHLEERRKQEAEVKELIGNAQREAMGVLAEFNPLLKRIDPYLEMVFVPPGAKVAGFPPARYALVRHNPGAPPSCIPITGPNGEFIEPNSEVFNLLAEGDLWHSEASRARKKRVEEAERQKQRRIAREREERKEEFADRAKAAFNPGVSFTDMGGWRYRAGAPKAR